MKKTGLAGLAAGAAVSVFALAAQAAEVPEGTQKAYVNEYMGTRLFAISMDRTGNHIEVHRGSSDDVVGFVCEWKAQGDIDPDTGDISVNFEDLGCSADREVPAEWNNYEHRKIDIWLPHTWSVSAEGSVFIERSESIRTQQDVQSNYERVWNVDAGEVCVTSSEGQYNTDDVFEPYLVRNRGCYDIPEGFYYPEMLQEEANAPTVRP